MASRKRELGFALYEVLFYLFFSVVAAAVVFSFGLSLFFKRQALDYVELDKVLEGSVAIAYENCVSGTLNGSVDVGYFNDTVTINYTCIYLSSNLMHVTVNYENIQKESYFFVD